MASAPVQTERLREQGLLLDKGYVGGRWTAADSGETFDVDDPASGEVLARLPRMGVDETRRAIEAAADAYPKWRSLLARERAQILRRWADSLLGHIDDLALLLTAEQGKPLAESKAEIAYAASFLEWFGEEAKRVYGDTIPTYMQDRRVVVIR
jgi:succinate-semialdehyde dehydrogenase/glutarate-semialdehyde dehydrogenase